MVRDTDTIAAEVLAAVQAILPFGMPPPDTVVPAKAAPVALQQPVLMPTPLYALAD